MPGAIPAVIRPREQWRPLLIVHENPNFQDRHNPLHLGLSRVKVAVSLRGAAAITSLTLTFRNTHNLDLAAELIVPLPEGGAVCGFALDVDGILVDGSSVEKQRGRQVFEKIVRQGIDPGLTEWVKGNQFRTRVYPVPAQGNRTVRVDYLSPLTPSAGGLEYVLPLVFPDRLQEFSLRVDADREAIPGVESGPPGFRFKPEGDRSLGVSTAINAAVDHDLVLSLAEASVPRALVEEAPDGHVYFYLTDFVDFEAAPAEQSETASGRIAVWWDASGSRDGRDLAAELELLRLVADQAARDGLAIDLKVFSHQVHEQTLFGRAGQDLSTLADTVARVEYDGATRLGSIRENDEESRPDFHLVFTDGRSTLGLDSFSGLTRPLFAVAADPRADHDALRRLTRRTGGDYFNLSARPLEEIIGLLGTPQFSFLDSSVSSGELSSVAPDGVCPAGRVFSLTGRLESASARVVLNYGYPGKPGLTREFTIDRSRAVPGDFLHRLWALARLDDLLSRPGNHEAEITAHGREHGLITPFNSLIVLESLEQYLEHEIEPPQTLPEMRREYLRLMAEKKKFEEAERESKLEHIVSLWKTKVEWWETTFDYEPPPQIESLADLIDGSVEELSYSISEMRVDAEMPEPAAMMAAGAPPPSESASAEPSDDGPPEPAGPTISIEPWDPDTPYLKTLKQADPADRLQVYFQVRNDHLASPAFFLDAAEFFLSRDEVETGLRILSNIAELSLENAALIRVAAHKLVQIGRLDEGIELFEEALRLRPEEPQSYRDLALALSRRAEADPDREGAAVDFARALELLHQVVMDQWDRFAEIEVIALMELNRLLPRAEAVGVTFDQLDKRLRGVMDLDLRIVLTWDADLTDLDLWVTEPTGEKAYYSNPLTAIGGHVSRDFTQGYGPEEYAVRRAWPGEYLMQVNYYGSSAVDLIGAVTLQVEVFTNYARPEEKREAITMRLEEKKDTVTVGTVNFEK